MRLLILLMIPLFCVSCAEWQVSNPAICETTTQSRIDHAGALLADGGRLSRATGATLLGQIEAGCGE